MTDDNPRKSSTLAARLDALLSSKSRSLPDSPRSSIDQSSEMVRSFAPTQRWWSSRPSASSTPSRSRSPDLVLLREALEEPLPRPPRPSLARPPRARLPDPFRPTTRPPLFLSTLTRTTLPTSSLTPQLPVAVHSHQPDISSDLIRPPPIVLAHFTPTRSSVDSLRSVSVRSHSKSISSISIDSTSPTSSQLPFNTTPAPATPSWWWFQSDTPPAKANDTTPSPTKKQYRSPRNPVVFCHGLLGFDSVMIGPAIAPLEVTHWRGIKEVLEENGTEVLITRVPATSSPVDRARVLEKKISEVYPGRSVHLIGHSMGGLDCRYLTTHLTHRKFRVLSITTIATPHRGSAFADHFLSTIGPARMPSVLSLLDLLPNGGGDGAAFECLTLESMRKFNEDTPDVPGVRYFSWGAVYEPGLIDTWKWPHSVILEREGPNDGLVSVESSKWGTYLGTLSQVNHLDLVGWINTARYKWAEMMGKEIKFRPATFYLGIADMLAREVEENENDGVGSSMVGSGVDVKADGPASTTSGECGPSTPADTNENVSRTPDGGQMRMQKQMVESLDAAGAYICSPSLHSPPDHSASVQRDTSFPSDITDRQHTPKPTER